MLRARKQFCAQSSSSVSSASGHCSPCSSDKRDTDDEDSELFIGKTVPDKPTEMCSKTSFEIVFESASSSDEESSSPSTVINNRWLPSRRSNCQTRDATEKVLSYLSDDELSVAVNCSESHHTNKSRATRLKTRLSNSISSTALKTTCSKHCDKHQSNDKLIEHQRPFKCQYKGCGRSYTAACGLKQHQSIHTDKYRCRDCGRRCATSAQLKHHQTSHKTIINRLSEKAEKPFECSIPNCRRRFFSRRGINRHKKQHEAVFECGDCGKCCSSKGKFIEHQRTHTGERPYKCQIEGCNHSYINRNSLIHHQKVHTNEHRCQDCGKRCQSRHALAKHRRTHLGHQFRCHFKGCDRTFRSEFNLSQHVAAHKRHSKLIKRTFKCPVPDCGQQFGSKEWLKRHTNEHKVKFWCRDCGRCCDSDARLKQHQQEMHGSENNEQFKDHRGSRKKPALLRKKQKELKKKQHQMEQINKKENQSKNSLKTFKKLPTNRLAKKKALENMRQQLDSSSEDSSFDLNDNEMNQNNIKLSGKQPATCAVKKRVVKLKPNSDSESVWESDLISDEDTRSNFSSEDSSTRDSKMVDNEVASNQSDISTVELSRGPEMKSVECQVNLDKEDASLKAKLQSPIKKLFKCRVKSCGHSFVSLFCLYKHKKEQHRRLRQCRECRKRSDQR